MFCFTSPFGSKLFNTTWLFMKINYFNAFFFFVFKYRPVNTTMTEATLNVNNNVDICSIPSNFTRGCGIEKKLDTQNQWSMSSPCVWKAVHNRTFWRTLIEEHFFHCELCHGPRVNIRALQDLHVTDDILFSKWKQNICTSIFKKLQLQSILNTENVDALKTVEINRYIVFSHNGYYM